MGAAGKGDNLRFAICQYMSYFPFFGGKFFKTKDHPNLGAENEGANRKSQSRYINIGGSMNKEANLLLGRPRKLAEG